VQFIFLSKNSPGGTLSEQSSHGHVPLIGHPYDDSSAAYLGTTILTILSFQQPI
jgi:hypothetical protein